MFNVDHIDDKVFEVFSEANTLEVFVNPNFKIKPEIYDKYIDTINYYIDNPPPKPVAVFPLTVAFVRVISELLADIPPPKNAVLSVTVIFVIVAPE